MFITMYQYNSWQTKLANEGSPSIWVGFAEGHLVGTYCVYSLKTKKVILTKDMTFLQKSYSEWNKVKKPLMVPTSYDDDDDDDEEEVKMAPENNQNNNHYDNVVSNSESDDKENIFDKDVNNEDHDPQDHCQCKSDKSYEEFASLVQQECQQNC